MIQPKLCPMHFPSGHSQAFLGEHVPLSTILSEAPLVEDKVKPIRGTASMLRRAGSKLNSKLARVSKPDDQYSTSVGSDSSRIARSSVIKSTLKAPDSTKSAEASKAWSSPPAKSDAMAFSEDEHDIDGVRPAITAIRRARKLEDLFGSLPPRQLYSHSRTHSPQPSNGRKTLVDANQPAPIGEESTEEHRYVSSNTSDGTKIYGPGSSLYRSSIASLRFIAESGDTTLLDGLARLVLVDEAGTSDKEKQIKKTNGKSMASARHDYDDGGSTQGDVSSTDDEGASAVRMKNKHLAVHHNPNLTRLSGETDSTGSLSTNYDVFDTHFSFSEASGRHDYLRIQTRAAGRDSVLSGQTINSSLESAFDMTSRRSISRASSRSSIESVRLQFKRAHKLAQVFGTTRGEVFKRVLDDIVADIQELDEDEELSESERRDVLYNVAALRTAF